VWRPGPGARVIRAEAGDRLGRFLTREGGDRWSGRQIKTWLELGCCRINGRVERFASRVLAHGDVVEFSPPTTDTEHTFDPRRVLLDQDGIIAYDKPAWLPVTRTDAPKSWSLTDILAAALGTAIPVHRLDADTSGIVLMARSAPVARRLEALFAEHAVTKEYLAIVRGHPRDAGEHRSYLVQVEARTGTERWKSGRGPDAREAITTWRVEEHLGTYGSRVRVLPRTGRYHQIRLHFSEMGHPIYGDLVYGDRRDPIPAHRHLLHACQIAFTHPITGNDIIVRSRIPREFAAAETALRRL
jgi:RluA family pseudouridine synthase